MREDEGGDEGEHLLEEVGLDEVVARAMHNRQLPPGKQGDRLLALFKGDDAVLVPVDDQGGRLHLGGGLVPRGAGGVLGEAVVHPLLFALAGGKGDVAPLLPLGKAVPPQIPSRALHPTGDRALQGEGEQARSLGRGLQGAIAAEGGSYQGEPFISAGPKEGQGLEDVFHPLRRSDALEPAPAFAVAVEVKPQGGQAAGIQALLQPPTGRAVLAQGEAMRKHDRGAARAC